MSTENNALTVVSGGALVSAEEQAAALAALMAEDAGDGLQNVTAADIAIPYLKLLQKGSPQCEEGNQAFMEAAKAGLLLNSVTNDLIDIRDTQKKFAIIVPVSYWKGIVEWRPNNGGIVQKHPMSQVMLDSATRVENPEGGVKLVNAAGNTLEETAEYHVLLLTAAGGVFWGIIAMAGSKLSPAKKLMNLITTKVMPSGKQYAMYSHMYRVEAFLDSSKRTGKTYQNFRFTDGGRITDPGMYKAAKDYKQAIDSGKAKAADETAGNGEAANTGSGEEVPF